MPIVNLFGREYVIPFDPEGVANLLYRGINVFPDEHADEKQRAMEQKAIDGHLAKLWKDEKLRTVPGRNETSDFSPPVIDEGMTAGGKTRLSTTRGNTKLSIMKTMPTPMTTFNLRDIVPDEYKKPNSIEL